MATKSNPPPLQVPGDFMQDRIKAAFFNGLINTIYRLWTITNQMRTVSKVLTSDATVTAALRIPVRDGTAVMISANIVARRTGGSAGTPGDTAWYQLQGAYKNIGGVLTGIGTPDLIGGEDQAGWNVGFSTSGTEALVTVLGAVDNEITWVSTVSSYEVGA